MYVVFLHLIRSQNYNDMLGELYLQAEMPEPPKESFFKGLFGGGAKSIDREELCEYASSKQIVQLIPTRKLHHRTYVIL